MMGGIGIDEGAICISDGGKMYFQEGPWSFIPRPYIRSE
jgi:hypothetical protein